MNDYTDTEVWLARALLNFADSAGIPDSRWQTDERIHFARVILGVSEHERYTRCGEWSNLYET